MPGCNAPQITEKSVDPTELADLIRLVMADGKTVCFDAPGKSMEPFIHSKDTIFVSPVGKKLIQTGDVIVFVHPGNGRVLAHRAVRITNGRFYSMGDNDTSRGDGWISFNDVLGRVVRIQRDGKDHSLGLGPEKWLIALLLRGNKLVPIVNLLRRIKLGIKRFFTARV
jgi:signal peptidase I